MTRGSLLIGQLDWSRRLRGPRWAPPPPRTLRRFLLFATWGTFWASSPRTPKMRLPPFTIQPPSGGRSQVFGVFYQTISFWGPFPGSRPRSSLLQSFPRGPLDTLAVLFLTIRSPFFRKTSQGTNKIVPPLRCLLPSPFQANPFSPEQPPLSAKTINSFSSYRYSFFPPPYRLPLYGNGPPPSLLGTD